MKIAPYVLSSFKFGVDVETDMMQNKEVQKVIQTKTKAVKNRMFFRLKIKERETAECRRRLDSP